LRATGATLPHALGMRFGGRPLLEATIGEMLAAVAGGKR
jgi:hypothetical protein